MTFWEGDLLHYSKLNTTDLVYVNQGTLNTMAPVRLSDFCEDSEQSVTWPLYTKIVYTVSIISFSSGLVGVGEISRCPEVVL